MAYSHKQQESHFRLPALSVISTDCLRQSPLPGSVQCHDNTWFDFTPSTPTTTSLRNADYHMRHVQCAEDSATSNLAAVHHTGTLGNDVLSAKSPSVKQGSLHTLQVTSHPTSSGSPHHEVTLNNDASPLAKFHGEGPLQFGFREELVNVEERSSETVNMIHELNRRMTGDMPIMYLDPQEIGTKGSTPGNRSRRLSMITMERRCKSASCHDGRFSRWQYINLSHCHLASLAVLCNPFVGACALYYAGKGLIILRKRHISRRFADMFKGIFVNGNVFILTCTWI